MKSIESKLISVCLINDYSIIAKLHILIYERAKFSSISLECTKILYLITLISNLLAFSTYLEQFS